VLKYQGNVGHLSCSSLVNTPEEVEVILEVEWVVEMEELAEKYFVDNYNFVMDSYTSDYSGRTKTCDQVEVLHLEYLP